jgi:hypothetical protein
MINIKLTDEQITIVVDAVAMLMAETKRIMDNEEEIIPPLAREAENVIDNCSSILDKIETTLEADIGYNDE